MWRTPLLRLSAESVLCPTIEISLLQEGLKRINILTDSNVPWLARSAWGVPGKFCVLPNDPVNGILEAIGHITTHLGSRTSLDHLAKQISNFIRNNADGEFMLLYPFP